MDKRADNFERQRQDFEQEIMLLVNERLFNKGMLTEEMYIKAKELIIKENSITFVPQRAARKRSGDWER